MKKVALSLGVLVVLFVTSVTMFGRTPTRIRFARGATSAIASGSLRSYRSKKVFVIRVRGGQTLSTRQIISSGSNRYVTIYIKSPSGDDAGDSDASCNNRREIRPTEGGDYRIEVVECQKADPWRGTFKLMISVQ